MAFLGRGKKEDLFLIATEMSIKNIENLKLSELKNAIIGDKDYDEDFVKELLNSVMEERKRKEQDEKEEKMRKEQDEKEEKMRKEQDEKEEKMRKENMEFELQKLRLENEKQREENENKQVSDFHFKPKLDLRDILQKFDPKTNDISLYLVLFERQVKRAEVKKELWVSHLIGLLPYDVTQIIARENEDVTDDYEKVKELLLKRYKLTPEKFRQLFIKHHKRSDITWVDFAYELRNYFNEWIKGLGVKTFEQLSDLMITDQIKQKVSPAIKEHFIDIWSSLKTPDEITAKLEDYENVRMSLDPKQKDTFRKEFFKRSNFEREEKEEQKYSTFPKYVPPQFRQQNFKNIKKEENAFPRKFVKECYICGQPHFARDCPKRYNKSPVKKNDILTAEVRSELLKSAIEINPLQFTDILVDNQIVSSLIDSGSQIVILHSKYASNSKTEKGKIILTSAFGEKIEAILMNFQMSLKKNNDQQFSRPIEVLAAVTDKIQGQCIIPPNIYDLLKRASEENVEIIEFLSPELQPTQMVDENIVSEFFAFNECDRFMCSSITDEAIKEEKCFDRKSEYLKLREEQNTCKSLNEIRKKLSSGKGNFYELDGLLFHKEKVLGETINQLILPECRRSQVLKLAHESVFASHMGLKKTKERIRYSFYWPNMTNDIAEFCKSCKECQLRSPEKAIDKIPITPVLRPELPFECVNVDVIGKIEPPSARGHKYVLVMVDQHSRWPEAIPLRSLTAKAACDALLDIFMRTGIPNIIASDQGTNFISGLTQEFMQRLGCAPRFSVPGYAASNGLVERYNKVLKNCLHHVIRTDPKNWDKYIPYLLFAYREVPNCTTGVSPFKLLYGREARGPLTVLKSSWCGEIPIPLNMKNSVIDYLQELKINLERAAEQASLIASDKQQAYANYFNRRTATKEFKVGEQVYLLIPDSTCKLYARWTGPGEIVEYCPPHSYKVKLTDGKVRHCHVNKIRKYHPRVNGVGIIFEDDEDFGEIHASPRINNENNFGDIIRNLDLQHLSPGVKGKIMEILHTHQTIFTGKVKIAKVGEHKIRIDNEKERKKPYIYRIPEALKYQVDAQIDELIELNLIEESSAEIAHPIVCVNKKDGGMRMCVDYRSLNAVTKVDDFPMEDAVQLIHCIGKTNVISTLDLLKGYWAIPMEEESRDLTSFKTHRSQYRFKVMPFGLRNAAATFQREMNKALSPYKDFCRAYIDDIAIFSSDISTHLQHLDIVLTKLKELNFTVNLQKCLFAKPQIKYLGHIIGSGRHQADPDKIKAIARLSRPENKKQLRSVLGLCNYYREYIPSYAEIAFPLTELTKKKVPDLLPWCDEHDVAFNKLKSALIKAPALHTPALDKPFVIHTDASLIGIGACLSQVIEGKMCPIAYASQKLSKTQQAWSTIEREAFAIVWGLKKFETMIFGSEILVYTDHNPLPYLTKCAPQSSRLQRWVFALQRFNMTLKHCPGAKMPHADALSRLFSE